MTACTSFLAFFAEQTLAFAEKMHSRPDRWPLEAAKRLEARAHAVRSAGTLGRRRRHSAKTSGRADSLANRRFVNDLRGCERTTKVLSQPLLAVDTVPVCPIRPAHAICYGNRTEIFVPLPSSLASEICALWSCAMCFTMDRPSPVPPASRERLLSTR